jgi:5-methylcytosine-specific restriction endonuclease McrA
MDAAQPTHCLLLNADFTPLKVVTWKRAVELIFDERADLVEHYLDRFIRSVSTAQPWPAVVRLRQYVSSRARIRFNRQNVLARDGYRCGYCGDAPKTQAGKPRLEDLTLDHVIPRAQSKNGTVRTKEGRTLSVTCWENVICCCAICNLKKADRTPGQAGMVLRVQPRAPSTVDVLRMHLRKVDIPDEWITYLPEAARDWRGYWTDELTDD